MADDDAPSDLAADRIDVDAFIREACGALVLNGFEPLKAGRALGMSDKAIQFAVGLLQGRNATDALRAIGHKAGGSVLRSAASKMARSPRVRKFLAQAAEHKAGLDNTPLDDDAKLKILAGLARSDNPAIQIRAVEAHRQQQNDIAARGRDGVTNPDPLDTLRQIAVLSPLCATLADELARVHNIKFSSADLPAPPASEANKQAVAGINGVAIPTPAKDGARGYEAGA